MAAMKKDTGRKLAPGRPGSARRAGGEMRALAWLVRHPGFALVTALLVTSWAYVGLLVTAYTVGGLALALTVWGRAHPASFDAIAAPRLRATWRRWWTYRGTRWAEVLKDCELVRENGTTGATEVPRVLRVTAPTPSIDTVHVRMVRGQDERVWTDRAVTLGHALEAERVSISKLRPGRVLVVVERRNPFTAPVPPPLIPAEPEDVDLTALEIGDDERGGISTVSAIGGAAHVLGVGETGSGKSGLIWCPLRAMGPMIRERWVRIHMIDLKGGMETAAARPLFHRWATTPAEALKVITEFRDSMRADQERLRKAGLRCAPVGPDWPLDVLIIDEVAMLTAYGDDRKIIAQAIRLLGETMTQGRSTGHTVWAFLQEPLKDILEVRDLFTTRICLAVSAASHVDAALGADMRERGAFADEIPLDPAYTGVGFRVDKSRRQVYRIRVGHVTDADIAELVRTCTPRDDQPPHLSVVGEVA